MGKVMNEERDEAACFLIERCVSNSQSFHIHRNLEIYGVVKGKVLVTIAGQSKELTDGQLAIIEGLENHSYEMDEEAEVISLHIGTRYLRNFLSLYPNKRLPAWLMDTEYNRILFASLENLLDKEPESIPEMKKIGITCQLISDIIENYGLRDNSCGSETDKDMITDVVQYIYEHYRENITLETLSKVFYISPKALSKKIRKRLNVDLRVFVNDIRVQKAIQMIDDPKNKDKTLNEIATTCGFNNMGTFYRSYERNFKSRKLDKE